MKAINLQRRQYLFLSLLFLSGMLADFILVGVFKVVWIVIYGTTYFALAMTIETFVARSKLHILSRKSVIIFLTGTLLGHLAFVDYHRRDQYVLSVLSMSPMVFQSEAFPEFLYVTSPALTEKLTKSPGNKAALKMETETVTDYGCRKTFAIMSIEGVEISSDKQTTWALRHNKLGVFSNLELPTVEEKFLPWCKLKFYRSNF